MQRMTINIVRIAIPHNSCDVVANGTMKSQPCDPRPDAVAIDQLGIAEDLWSNAEMTFDLLAMRIDLLNEVIISNEARQRMIFRFAEELNSACIRESPEAIDH